MNFKTIIKVVIPVLIFAFAIGIYEWQMSNHPVPQRKEKKKIIPIVSSTVSEVVDGHRYLVSGYGTVQAASQVDIVSEVSGKVIWVNDKMKTGGMFRKNEGLYRVDDTEYQAALDEKIASLKSSEYDLKTIEAEAAISNKEWEIWNETGKQIKKAVDLVSYTPQLASARAAVKSAKSAVVSAQTNLVKTLYKAPFNAVVTSESIEHGKIISAGESAGELAGTDRYEVQVPISVKDAVRIQFSSDSEKASKGYVELIEGSHSWRWFVYADRVLPDADSTTGMLKAILVVSHPFDAKNKKHLLPIRAKVKTSLDGELVNDVVRIPDESLREGNVVWLLSHDSRVQIRKVHVSEQRNDNIYIDKGLVGGEEIITSSLEGVIEGMIVNNHQNKQQIEKNSGETDDGGVE